jgi:hypothetical protein
MSWRVDHPRSAAKVVKAVPGTVTFEGDLPERW